MILKKGGNTFGADHVTAGERFVCRSTGWKWLINSMSEWFLLPTSRRQKWWVVNVCAKVCAPPEHAKNPHCESQLWWIIANFAIHFIPLYIFILYTQNTLEGGFSPRRNLIGSFLPPHKTIFILFIHFRYIFIFVWAFLWVHWRIKKFWIVNLKCFPPAVPLRTSRLTLM